MNQDSKYNTIITIIIAIILTIVIVIMILVYVSPPKFTFVSGPTLPLRSCTSLWPLAAVKGELGSLI